MEMERREDEKALLRIIQMLLSLAVLAERASGRSLPVRWLVFWILRPAEAVAQAFVCDVAQEQFLFFADSACLDDEGSTQILQLAMRFRALAAALALLLAQPQHPAAQVRRRVGAARLVMRHLNGKAPVGPPNSRAPPAPFRARRAGRTPEPERLCGAHRRVRA